MAMSYIGLGAETSSAHSAPPRPSLALRVKTDKKAKAADVRDTVMRSVPFHYGWVILMAGGIGAFMTLPGQTNGVALFFDPLAADLGLTRAQVALAYTVGTLAGILPAPLVGRWIDRRGPRLAAGAIAIAMGLACVVMALTSSALTLTIGFAAIRGAAVGALSLVSQHVINLWFVTRRGMAATAASVGVALGGVAFPPVIETLIRAGGWRYAYLTLGVVVAGAMLPVGLLLFRGRPEQFGLSPTSARRVSDHRGRRSPRSRVPGRFARQSSGRCRSRTS